MLALFYSLCLAINYLGRDGLLCYIACKYVLKLISMGMSDEHDEITVSNAAGERLVHVYEQRSLRLPYE